MFIWLLTAQVNDTILKTAYRDIEVQSFDAVVVGSLPNDCIRELATESRSDGYTYVVAYDNEGNSGDIIRFPYRGIQVQGFTNPENVDQDLDCIYSFNVISQKGEVILQTIFDGTSRNDPDTAEVLKSIYKGIFLNSSGFPSPTGGYYAIKAFIAGIDANGSAFLRIDTTFNITPIDNPEDPALPPQDSVKQRDLSFKIHLGMKGLVNFVFQVPQAGRVHLQIFDMSGRRIFDFSDTAAKNRTYTISRHLRPGIYIAKFIWNEKKLVSKFISF